MLKKFKFFNTNLYYGFPNELPLNINEAEAFNAILCAFVLGFGQYDFAFLRRIFSGSQSTLSIDPGTGKIKVN